MRIQYSSFKPHVGEDDPDIEVDKVQLCRVVRKWALIPFVNPQICRLGRTRFMIATSFKGPIMHHK